MDGWMGVWIGGVDGCVDKCVDGCVEGWCMGCEGRIGRRANESIWEEC